jgi:hypothetical protein
MCQSVRMLLSLQTKLLNLALETKNENFIFIINKTTHGIDVCNYLTQIKCNFQHL